MQAKRYSCTLPLPSALDGMRGFRHAPANFALGKDPVYWIGDWVGPRDSMDGCWKSRPHRDSSSP